MNKEIMHIIREKMLKEMSDVIRGSIECWFDDDIINVRVSKNNDIIFEYKITDVLNLVTDGCSAKELAARVVMAYKKKILTEFFIKQI